MLNTLYRQFLREVEKIPNVIVVGGTYSDNVSTHLILSGPNLDVLCELRSNANAKFHAQFKYDNKNKKKMKPILKIKHDLEHNLLN